MYSLKHYFIPINIVLIKVKATYVYMIYYNTKSILNTNYDNKHVANNRKKLTEFVSKFYSQYFCDAAEV